MQPLALEVVLPPLASASRRSFAAPPAPHLGELLRVAISFCRRCSKLRRRRRRRAAVRADRAVRRDRLALHLGAARARPRPPRPWPRGRPRLGSLDGVLRARRARRAPRVLRVAARLLGRVQRVERRALARMSAASRARAAPRAAARASASARAPSSIHARRARVEPSRGERGGAAAIPPPRPSTTCSCGASGASPGRTSARLRPTRLSRPPAGGAPPRRRARPRAARPAVVHPVRRERAARRADRGRGLVAAVPLVLARAARQERLHKLVESELAAVVDVDGREHGARLGEADPPLAEFAHRVVELVDVDAARLVRVHLDERRAQRGEVVGAELPVGPRLHRRDRLVAQHAQRRREALRGRVRLRRVLPVPLALDAPAAAVGQHGRREHRARAPLVRVDHSGWRAHALAVRAPAVVARRARARGDAVLLAREVDNGAPHTAESAEPTSNGVGSAPSAAGARPRRRPWPAAARSARRRRPGPRARRVCARAAAGERGLSASASPLASRGGAARAAAASAGSARRAQGVDEREHARARPLGASCSPRQAHRPSPMGESECRRSSPAPRRRPRAASPPLPPPPASSTVSPRGGRVRPEEERAEASSAAGRPRLRSRREKRLLEHAAACSSWRAGPRRAPRRARRAPPPAARAVGGPSRAPRRRARRRSRRRPPARRRVLRGRLQRRGLGRGRARARGLLDHAPRCSSRLSAGLERPETYENAAGSRAARGRRQPPAPSAQRLRHLLGLRRELPARGARRLASRAALTLAPAALAPWRAPRADGPAAAPPPRPPPARPPPARARARGRASAAAASALVAYAVSLKWSCSSAVMVASGLSPTSKSRAV